MRGCGIFVHSIKIYYCEWFHQEQNGPQLGRGNRQDFWAKRMEMGDESSCAGDTNETWKELDIQNQKRLKKKATRQIYIDILG